MKYLINIYYFNRFGYNSLISVLAILIILLNIVPDNYALMSKEQAVWFYSGDFKKPEPRMIDDLLEKRFNTLYFSTVNDEGGWNNPEKVVQYQNFINYAKEKGMKVYAVTLEDPSYVLKDIEDVKNQFRNFIVNTIQLFDTYVIDVEPHTINIKYKNSYPDFNTNEKMYFENYIHMSFALRNVADNYNVKYIDTIPPNWHLKMKKNGIENGVGSLSSHALNLMAYESNIIESMFAIQDIKREISTEIVINLKITPGFNEPHIPYDEIPNTIRFLRDNSLDFAFWYASSILPLSTTLFAI